MTNIQRTCDKSELTELKEMNSQWSGEKVALQTRLSQQEQGTLIFHLVFQENRDF